MRIAESEIKIVEKERKTGLREKVMQGGVYLIVRQGIGLMIGLGGMILLTRMIGPTNYGLYISSIGILTYLLSLAGLGINVYLVRQEKDMNRSDYDMAFTLLLLTSFLIIVIGVILAPFYGQWIRSESVVKPLIVLMFSLPLTAISYPAMAKLERNLNYRAVAILELFGQIIYYVLALGYAFGNGDIWAPVLGYIGQQVVISLGAFYLSRYIPRLYWSRKGIREMIGYGVGYSSSLWVWQIRNLVNPMIVGRLAGPEVMGFVALAIRMVETLGFIRSATWRLSIAALAKLQGDRERLKKALDEAMGLQVLAFGPLLIGFSVVAPWIVPLFFGERWVHMLSIFPFIALGYLINTIFNMHSSVLYVLKRNWDVTFFHIGHVLLFVGGAIMFVPTLGGIGYGLAEVLALIAYIIIHNRILPFLTPSYKKVSLLLIGFVPALFFVLVPFPWGIPLLIPLGLLFFNRPFRQELVGLLSYFKKRKVAANKS